MKPLRILLAASAVALTATTAGAQNVSGTVKFMSSPPNPAVTAFGYYVGPFSGTLMSDPSKPTIDLFCLDVMNAVTWGQQWAAKFTNLGPGLNLTATRGGSANETNYKKAAWLITQYDTHNTSYYAGIQSAIWNLFNPGTPNGGTNVNDSHTEAYWLAQANIFANSAAYNTFDYSRFTVVTDVNAAGKKVGGVQEFITRSHVTPEPETYLLMATGLIGVIGIVGLRGRLS
jgi:hypothetical protein